MSPARGTLWISDSHIPQSLLDVLTWMSYRYPKLVVQSLSHVQLFATSWIAARQASLPFTISQSLFKLMSIESVMPSSHLVLCRPLLLPPSIFPRIRVFSKALTWPLLRIMCLFIGELSGSRVQLCITVSSSHTWLLSTWNLASLCTSTDPRCNTDEPKKMLSDRRW